MHCILEKLHSIEKNEQEQSRVYHRHFTAVDACRDLICLLACSRDYFFTPRTASFVALATRNLTPVLAGILVFLLRLGVESRPRFSFLFHQLPKTWQYEFAGLFDLFVCQRAECIE